MQGNLIQSYFQGKTYDIKIYIKYNQTRHLPF